MNKKIAWLNSIGAIESDRKEFQWHVPAADMYYSEEYIKNTPLEKLQAGYERHIRFITDKRKPAISILKKLNSQGFDEYDIAHILDESKRLLIEHSNDYGKMMRRFRTAEKALQIIIFICVLVMAGCHIAIAVL